MKILAILILLVFQLSASYAQPVITSNDMPSPGNINTFNRAASVIGTSYQQTGNNHTWDFSGLLPLSQSADTFVNINTTPLLYQIAFFAASAALKQGNLIQAGITLSDVYNFYKNSTSSFSLLGYGAKINGMPIPVKYDNPDILYKFPLNVGNIDSTNSSFNVNLTGIGYYGQNKKRINHVDGWGTLYLPADTFQVLRVKSDIMVYDTIFYDSLGFGIGINRTETEYKWLAGGHKRPVLEITQTGPATNVTFYGNINNSINEHSSHNVEFSIFPNPVEDQLFIKIKNLQSGKYIFSILSITGAILSQYETDRNNLNEISEEVIHINRNIINAGIYIAKLETGNVTQYRKFIIK